MFSKTYKALIASVLMGAVVFLLTYFLEQNKVPNLLLIFVVVIAGVIIYLGICLVTKEPISRSIVTKLFLKQKKE